MTILLAKEFLQYIVDDNQQKMEVIIPIAQWQDILEELEELYDIRAYDAAKAESDEAVIFEQGVTEIKRDNGQSFENTECNRG